MIAAEANSSPALSGIDRIHHLHDSLASAARRRCEEVAGDGTPLDELT